MNENQVLTWHQSLPNTSIATNNYSQILDMPITGREKLEYIMGKTDPPKETDATYAKWYAENQKVKGWLLTSMSQEIMKRYLRLCTAREI